MGGKTLQIIPRESNKKWFLIQTLIMTLLLVLIGFAIYVLIAYPRISSYRASVENSERIVVEQQRLFLQDSIDQIEGDLTYLTKMRLMAAYINAEDLKRSELYRSELEYEFYRFMMVDQSYDQLRFLDTKGMETIRINRRNGDVLVVPVSELQDKNNRYYFADAMEVPDGVMYQSPLDLNVEMGAIEEPHRPMVRFALKVFDNAGNTAGIVLINYNASRMLETFERISAAEVGDSYLLNTSGYYLAGGDEANFAFMWEDRQRDGFFEDYPDIWYQIDGDHLTEKVYQQYVDVGLMTVTETANISEEYHDAHWYLVTLATEEISPYFKNVPYYRMLLDNFLELWGLIFPVFVLAWIIVLTYTYRRIHLASITELARIDHLTGTFNRSAGMKVLGAGLDYALNNDLDYSVCYIDLNDLKHVNDSKGHEVGDAYLNESVGIIRSCFRRGDQLIRMGGDEFLIGIHGSSAVIEKNWQKVLLAIDAFNRQEVNPFIISLSHGVASVQEEGIEDIDRLIALADERMYMEKRRIKGLR